MSRDAVAFAGRRYLDAILRAGGEPVVISPQPLKTKDAEAMMQRFDGLVFMFMAAASWLPWVVTIP